MNIKEWAVTKWTELNVAQDRDQLRAFVNSVMNIWVP